MTSITKKRMNKKKLRPQPEKILINSCNTKKNHDIHYYVKNEQEEVTHSTKENTHQFMQNQKNHDIHY